MWNACRVNNILFLIRFRGTRGRKIVTTHTIFCDHKFFQILGSYADRRLHQNALLEPVVLMQNSIFEKTYFFQQKSLKSIFARHCARRGAKSWPSWRRHLSTVLSTKMMFVFSFGPPKCRECFRHLRRFLTLYPSREGLYGVRPNTLKQMKIVQNWSLVSKNKNFFLISNLCFSVTSWFDFVDSFRLFRPLFYYRNSDFCLARSDDAKKLFNFDPSK